MITYRTSEVAMKFSLHPNTVRFYEAQGLLPQVPRMENGYRIYDERHILGLRLIRLAFQAEILSDHLRDEAVAIVKMSAVGRQEEAIVKTVQYRKHLQEEIIRAQEAIALVEQILKGGSIGPDEDWAFTRREAAAQIDVSMDVLRDWERNGLIAIPRKGNRRRYGPRGMNHLKIIAILRSAHYSQMAIRRMLMQLDKGETDLLSAIDTPENTEDIVSVTDRYITSLFGALDDAKAMLHLLQQM